MTQEERRLLKAWVILIGLTSVSVLAAFAGQSLEGGPGPALAVLMGTAFIKTRQVLDHFLDLREARAGWRSFFTFLMAALLLLLLGIGLIPILVQEAP
ncbi:MAG: hypothetical protein EPN26_14485 [Rhodospirillales bacterium]|nr:MAG: hypothetical protein EPN26_14485 [Rhodospirillales bacterium]